MRRIMYLWLPHWPIDRLRLVAAGKNSAAPAEAAPFATVAEAAGRRLLAAVNPAAAAAGLAPGMPLADALSFLPGLATAAAEPAEDAAALRRLAEWCGRYSPWTAPDGADGVRIEITGSAHLWGGEAALAADLTARLARRRVASRIAIADTLGAAWALARFAAKPATAPSSCRRRESSRRSGAAAGRGPAPRPGHRRRAAAGRAEADRRSLCDAARCAGPPFRRDGGAASRPGARATCPSRCRRWARRRSGGCG